MSQVNYAVVIAAPTLEEIGAAFCALKNLTYTLTGDEDVVLVVRVGDQEIFRIMPPDKPMRTE